MKPILAILLFAACLPLSAQEEAPYHIFSIYFGGGSHHIDGQQAEELRQWLQQFPDFKQYEISVHSHTDDIGSKEYNDWLSRNRSESAFRKLMDNGVLPDQISVEDFGELNPVYDNSTWEGKLKNRRVDIILKPIAT
ncbi:MAG: OmpA family protein [Lewinellaceae bacterium]|nr:OmpA family protein [Phaeodactylibacter sp.]MCB0612146.1 OmpA family protein [Phaeodactylibacter sp.]MCB9348424.1 OmpA family protein [Lewinellaceae bacterium]